MKIAYIFALEAVYVEHFINSIRIEIKQIGASGFEPPTFPSTPEGGVSGRPISNGIQQYV